MPVVGGDLRRVARPLLLNLKLGLETLDVNLYTRLLGDKFREVDGKPVGVVQHKGILARYNAPLATLYHTIQEVYSCRQGSKERCLLLLDNSLYEVLLSTKFGELSPHLRHKTLDKTTYKWLRETEVGVSIAYRTTQDTTDNIPRLYVRGQLPIGYRECNGTQVVGDNTHSDIALFVRAILLARHPTQTRDSGGKDICIVVRLLALQNHTQPLESHACVDMLRGKWL